MCALTFGSSARVIAWARSSTLLVRCPSGCRPTTASRLDSKDRTANRSRIATRFRRFRSPEISRPWSKLNITAFYINYISFDLLHALKDVESDHRISAECGVRGSNPHSRGTGSIPAKLSFSPLYRAVAQSMRPHRIPCHRHVNHRWSTAPCGSGQASHRIRSTLYYVGSHQNDYGRNPPRPLTVDVAPGLPLDLRLKTQVCARKLYKKRWRIKANIDPEMGEIQICDDRGRRE